MVREYLIIELFLVLSTNTSVPVLKHSELELLIVLRFECKGPELVLFWELITDYVSSVHLFVL